MNRFLSSSLALSCLLTSVTPSVSADLETIRQRGKLIVAVKDNMPPLGFTDAQGNLQGFEIDIAKRLSEEILGSPNAIILQPVSNVERLQAVIERKVDLSIARVTITPARSRIVDFSAFYYLDSTGIITLNPSILRLEDLTTARIAVLNNSGTIAVLRSRLPTARLIAVTSYEEARDLLEKGEVDAFAGDNSVLAGWVREFPRYRQLPISLGVTALGVVLPKGLQYQSLREQVNETIENLHSSGWLKQRATYWGLP